MDNSRITIVISTPGFAFYYLKQGVIDRLCQAHNVTLVVDSKVKLSQFYLSGLAEILIYENDTSLEEKYGLAQIVTSWTRRKVSRTFKWRIKRELRSLWYKCFEYARTQYINKTYGDDVRNEYMLVKGKRLRRRICFDNSKFVMFMSSIFLKQYKIFRLRLVIKFLGYRFVYPFFQEAYIKKLPTNSSLETAITNSSPDLVVFPNIAWGANSILVSQIARDVGAKSLYLIDNWDNLSSKTALWTLPDYMCTWGEQSNSHAVKVQGMPRKNIFNIGTPRFEGYLKTKLEHIESINNLSQEYILFLDTLNEFDVFKILRIIGGELNAWNSEQGTSLKIIFRPHPTTNLKRKRALKNFFEIEGNIEFDSLTSSTFERSLDGKVDNVPDFDYLPSLIRESRFIVGGLTSMMIEAGMMSKPYLALAHRELGNVVSPHLCLRNYLHLEGIENLPHLEICKSLDDIRSTFIDWIRQSPKHINSEYLESTLRYFYEPSKNSYGESLVELTSRILKLNN